MSNLVPTAIEVGRLPAPTVLTDKEITMILEISGSLKKFIEDIEAYALKQMIENGITYEGFKVVEGKSNRCIKDPEALLNQMRADGYQDAVLFRAPQMETLTNLEKLVGKKEFTLRYGNFIEKPQGKPTIAPDTDKRPVFAFISAEDDFADDLKLENKGE